MPVRMPVGISDNIIKIQVKYFDKKVYKHNKYPLCDLQNNPPWQFHLQNTQEYEWKSRNTKVWLTHFINFCYHGDVVEDAGGLLAAAAGQRAEDNFHQVLSVSSPLLTQPQHHLF